MDWTKEQKSEYFKQYRIRRRAHRAAVKHIWYMKNRVRIIEKQKQYAKSHQSEVNEWHRKVNSEILLKCKHIKGSKCAHCGSVDSLHFHHIDPTEKKFKISSCYSLTNTVLDELKKCVMLCRPCHVKEHKRMLNVEEESSCSNYE